MDSPLYRETPQTRWSPTSSQDGPAGYQPFAVPATVTARKFASGLGLAGTQPPRSDGHRCSRNLQKDANEPKG